MACLRNLIVDPPFFLGKNGSRSPDTLANIAPERFLKVGNNTPPNPVSQRGEILVRGVFSKLQPVLAYVLVDLRSPHVQQRPRNLQFYTADLANRDGTHRSEPGRSRAAKEIDQKRLHQVIGVMGEKDSATSLPPGGLGKESVTSLPRRGFDRHSPFCSQRANICRADLKLDPRTCNCRASGPLAVFEFRQAMRLPYNSLVVIRNQFFHESRVRRGRTSTEQMVKMAEHQTTIAGFDEPVQQRHRIAASRHSNQVSPMGREAAQENRFILNPGHRVAASKFQRATMNLQRSSTFETSFTNGSANSALRQNRHLAASWFIKDATGQREIPNRSDRQERAGHTVSQKITNFMNTEHELTENCQRPNVMNKNRRQYTYALLERSREKSRDILENTLFVVFVLTVLVAIWQFAVQAAPILGNPPTPIHHPISRQHLVVQHRAA
jgi:hypothetical protein